MEKYWGNKNSKKLFNWVACFCDASEIKFQCHYLIPTRTHEYICRGGKFWAKILKMNKFRGEQQRYGKERELSIVGIFQKVYYAMLQVIKKLHSSQENLHFYRSRLCNFLWLYCRNRVSSLIFPSSNLKLYWFLPSRTYRSTDLMLIKIIDFDFSTYAHHSLSIIRSMHLPRKKIIKNLVSIGRNYKLKIFH